MACKSTAHHSTAQCVTSQHDTPLPLHMGVLLPACLQCKSHLSECQCCCSVSRARPISCPATQTVPTIPLSTLTSSVGTKNVPTAVSGICPGLMSSTVSKDLNRGAFLASKLCSEPGGLVAAELALTPVLLAPMAAAGPVAVPAPAPASAALEGVLPVAMVGAFRAGCCCCCCIGRVTPTVPSVEVPGISAAAAEAIGRGCLGPAVAASAPILDDDATSVAVDAAPGRLLSALGPAPMLGPCPSIPVGVLGPAVPVDAVVVAGIHDVSAAVGRPCACTQFRGQKISRWELCGSDCTACWYMPQ